MYNSVAFWFSVINVERPRWASRGPVMKGRCPLKGLRHGLASWGEAYLTQLCEFITSKGTSRFPVPCHTGHCWSNYSAG